MGHNSLGGGIDYLLQIFSDFLGEIIEIETDGHLSAFFQGFPSEELQKLF